MGQDTESQKGVRKKIDRRGKEKKKKNIMKEEMETKTKETNKCNHRERREGLIMVVYDYRRKKGYSKECVSVVCKRCV